MRAKFKVECLADYGYNLEATLSAVYGGTTNKEDNQFSEATPNGKLTMTISNPAAKGFLKVGKKYYLDFTEAPE